MYPRTTSGRMHCLFCMYYLGNVYRCINIWLLPAMMLDLGVVDQNTRLNYLLFNTYLGASKELFLIHAECYRYAHYSLDWVVGKFPFAHTYLESLIHWGDHFTTKIYKIHISMHLYFQVFYIANLHFHYWLLMVFYAQQLYS